MLSLAQPKYTWRGAAWILVLAAVLAAAPVDSAIPGTPVAATIADPTREFELRSATASANGSGTELIVAARAKDGPPGSETLLWASVDAAGRVRLREDSLGSLPTARGAESGKAFALAGGREYIVSPSLNGGTALIRLARPNEPVARPVSLSGSPEIARVRSAGANKLVLIGREGSQALVAEIDTDGKRLASFPIPGQGFSAVDAVFDPAGNAVIACEQGVSRDASAWVFRVARNGAVLAKNSFPGRPTGIARGIDGTYLVLIDKSGAEGSEVLMKGLSADMNEQWTRSIAVRQRVATSFVAAEVPSGGFIVAGVKDRGLWVSRVKADGSALWTEARDPMKSMDLEIVTRVELVAVRDDFAAAYSAFVVSGREQRKVVRVLRFKAN